MERCLKSRRLRSWLQSELGLRGLGSVLLVALLAGCSSSSSPSASGGSGGNASDVTGGTSAQLISRPLREQLQKEIAADINKQTDVKVAQVVFTDAAVQ